MKEAIIGAIIGGLIGAAGGYFIAIWQNNITKRNTKIELYTEAKILTDKLYSLYVQQLDADTQVSFYRTMLQNNPTMKFYTYENEHTDSYGNKVAYETQENSKALKDQREKSDELQIEIDKIKDEFKAVSEKIRFNFNIDKESDKIIIEIAVLKASPVFFNRVDYREVRNHDQLLEWVENAKEQGKKILDERYNKPRLEMLKRLKDQI